MAISAASSRKSSILACRGDCGQFDLRTLFDIGFDVDLKRLIPAPRFDSSPKKLKTEMVTTKSPTTRSCR